MKGLGRVILVGIVWLLTLGCADIEIKYKDGLRIHYKGWGKKVFKINNIERNKK